MASTINVNELGFPLMFPLMGVAPKWFPSMGVPPNGWFIIRMENLYIWVNYNDLTATSLEIIISKGNHPQMALIQVTEILQFTHIYIYIYVFIYSYHLLYT